MEKHSLTPKRAYRVKHVKMKPSTKDEVPKCAACAVASDLGGVSSDLLSTFRLGLHSVVNERLHGLELAHRQYIEVTMLAVPPGLVSCARTAFSSFERKGRAAGCIVQFAFDSEESIERVVGVNGWAMVNLSHMRRLRIVHEIPEFGRVTPKRCPATLTFLQRGFDIKRVDAVFRARLEML